MLPQLRKIRRTRLNLPNLLEKSQPRASPIRVRTYGHQRGAGQTPNVPLSSPKAPLSCSYFSFFFSLSVSSFFFNIFFFSCFCSCVTEPLQPLRITDKANRNVPTNNLNRLALLKPSPFSRPLRRAAIKYATSSTQPTSTKVEPDRPRFLFNSSVTLGSDVRIVRIERPPPGHISIIAAGI